MRFFDLFCSTSASVITACSCLIFVELSALIASKSRFSCSILSYFERESYDELTTKALNGFDEFIDRALQLVIQLCHLDDGLPNFRRLDFLDLLLKDRVMKAILFQAQLE